MSQDARFDGRPWARSFSPFMTRWENRYDIDGADARRLAACLSRGKKLRLAGSLGGAPRMDMYFSGRKEGRTLGLASWRLLLLSLAVLLAGCSPGANMVDDKALEARLDYQSAFPPPATLGFAPTSPGRYLRPDTTSFMLGPDDVVKISVANRVRPGHGAARAPGRQNCFLPGRRHPGGRPDCRTASRRNRESASRKNGPIVSAWHSGCRRGQGLRPRGSRHHPDHRARRFDIDPPGRIDPCCGKNRRRTGGRDNAARVEHCAESNFERVCAGI